MRRKIYALLVVLAASIGSAWAQRTTAEIDGINYILYRYTHSQWAYVGSNPDAGGDIIIPATVSYDGENYDVTIIWEHAFNGCTSLTSIELPDGIGGIGDHAFNGCTSLTSINLPSTINSIGESAFFGCESLTSLELPASVDMIGGNAFVNSGLTEITLHSKTPPALFGYRIFDATTTIIVPEESEEVYKTYNVCMNDGSMGGCYALWRSYASQIKSTPTSTEPIKGVTVTAYPNPTKGMITVTGLTAGKTINIYSLSGAQVGSYIVSADSITIDLSNLSRGIYYLVVEGQTIKVIRQ